MSGFSEAIRKVWYMPQHCEKDKLPSFKGRIFLCKAKCCLTLHRSCRFSLEYLQLYQFPHVWKSTGGPHLAWISIFSPHKIFRRDRGDCWNRKCLVLFFPLAFLLRVALCAFFIFKSTFLIHSFIGSWFCAILGLECPAKTYKIQESQNLYTFWWPYEALTVCWFMGSWLGQVTSTQYNTNLNQYIFYN